MDNKILFVWDFHGVLEKDNVYAVRDLCNLVLNDFGFDRIVSLEEAAEYYGLSWLDFFKLILPQGDYKLWNQMVKRVLTLRERGWIIIKKYIKAREFAEYVLQEIKNNNHSNILLTNSSSEHAKRFTHFINLTSYLDDIKGIDYNWSCKPNQELHNLKGHLLLDFIKGKDYRKIIIIGDRESDIMAGKMCGAITYLFVDTKLRKQLIETKADYIISDLRQVLKEIDNP